MIDWLLALVLALFPAPVVPDPPPREVHQVASVMDILRQAGFSGNALNIAYAVVMAESSGNARAHNPDASTGDNSYGLFQINMLGAMGPERRRQYGLSSNDDLYDPLTNAKVAYKMSNGGRNWQPWSTYKSGAYKRFLGQSGQQVTNSGSGGHVGDPGAGTTVAKGRAETAESYGFTESLFNAVPELKKLFDKATKETWTPQKFQAALRDTRWFKQTSESERAYIVSTYGDPATARQKLDQAVVQVQQLSAQLGLKPSDAKLNEWAYGVVARGWGESTLREYMASSFEYGDDQAWGGEAGQALDEIKRFAWEMGVQPSNDWIQHRAAEIAIKDNTLEKVKADLRQDAKNLYTFWQKQIDSGQSVMDIASPYLQSMSQVLELPPGSLSLFDPTIKKALQYKDPKTGGASVKPLWQFENELRSDDRWKKTKNAQDSLMQVAHQVLADFGVKY